MNKLKKIMGDMVKRDASDLHIRAGHVPVFRINGVLYRLKVDKFMPEDITQFISETLSAEKLKKFESSRELDFAFTQSEIGRFRINAFYQKGLPALAIRLVKLEIPEFSSLRLPSIVKDLSLKSRGLILVTGSTGSGKSTALASMINHINQNLFQNIVTLEDPIEFLHSDKKSMISQREIGQDTPDFATAIRSAMRQDPDVILIGEIRDYETMHTALSAADTGHLVFSTLHTMNAMETINRVLSFYPPHQQDEAKILLSSTLVGVLSLRLLPHKDKKSRVPAAEVLVNTAHIRELLLEQNTMGEIKKSMEEGYTQYGSQTFDQSIFNLFSDDIISYEVAYRSASNPDDFELKTKGIEGTSDRDWMNA